MSVCTFFGHRDCPKAVAPELLATLVGLVEDHDVDLFFVGRQGEFDAIVRRILKQLAYEYPHIHFAVVLERLPWQEKEFNSHNYSNTIFPEGLENVHPRFAVSRRNKWMLKQADFVVTYITHSWGGAARFAEKARRQGKTVINLAEKGPDGNNT